MWIAWEILGVVWKAASSIAWVACRDHPPRFGSSLLHDLGFNWPHRKQCSSEGETVTSDYDPWLLAPSRLRYGEAVATVPTSLREARFYVQILFASGVAEWWWVSRLRVRCESDNVVISEGLSETSTLVQTQDPRVIYRVFLIWLRVFFVGEMGTGSSDEDLEETVDSDSPLADQLSSFFRLALPGCPHTQTDHMVIRALSQFYWQIDCNNFVHILPTLPPDLKLQLGVLPRKPKHLQYYLLNPFVIAKYHRQHKCIQMSDSPISCKLRPSKVTSVSSYISSFQRSIMLKKKSAWFTALDRWQFFHVLPLRVDVFHAFLAPVGPINGFHEIQQPADRWWRGLKLRILESLMCKELGLRIINSNQLQFTISRNQDARWGAFLTDDPLATTASRVWASASSSQWLLICKQNEVRSQARIESLRAQSAAEECGLFFHTNYHIPHRSSEYISRTIL